MLCNQPNMEYATTITETPGEQPKPLPPPVPKPKAKPDTTEYYNDVRRSDRPAVQVTHPSMNHYESISDETVPAYDNINDGNHDKMITYLSLVPEPNVTANAKNDYEELELSLNHQP